MEKKSIEEKRKTMAESKRRYRKKKKELGQKIISLYVPEKILKNDSKIIGVIIDDNKEKISIYIKEKKWYLFGEFDRDNVYNQIDDNDDE